MSNSLKIRPVENNWESVAGNSSLCDVLEMAFGSLPTELGHLDVDVLLGIMYAGYPEVKKIIDAIREYERIEIKVDH